MSEISEPVAASPVTPDDRVRKIVRNTSFVGFGLGVVLSPIPLADELLLLPVYTVMSARIGRARGLSVTKVPWRPIWKSTLAGLAARAAINVTVSFVPGVAAVANAASAMALTQILGAYVDEACASPEQAETLTAKHFIDLIKSKITRARTA